MYTTFYRYKHSKAIDLGCMYTTSFRYIHLLPNAPVVVCTLHFTGICTTPVCSRLYVLLYVHYILQAYAPEKGFMNTKNLLYVHYILQAYAPELQMLFVSGALYVHYILQAYAPRFTQLSAYQNVSDFKSGKNPSR